MERKFFIYAFDLERQSVTAVYPCPNEKVAELVLQHTLEDWKHAVYPLSTNRGGVRRRFMFGITSVCRSGHISLPPATDLLWHIQGYWNGWFVGKNLYGKARTDIMFSRQEFETVVTGTKMILSRMKDSDVKYPVDSRLDVRFIWCVYLTLKELGLNESSSSGDVLSTIQPEYNVAIEPPTEMYSAAKMHTSEPSEVALVEVDSDVLNTFGVSVYFAMLRALVDSKNPDEKYRRWAMWKSGVGYVDIAKSENPDWETQFGREQSQVMWASEAEKIRKQVTRLDVSMK